MQPYSVEEKIVINASSSVVWQVLTDFAAYREWCRVLSPETSVAPQLGTSVKMVVSSPAGASFAGDLEVTRFSQGLHFAWQQKVGPLETEYHFELSPLVPGQSQLQTYVDCSGLFRPLLQNVPVVRQLPEIIAALNAEIRRRAEALVTVSA